MTSTKRILQLNPSSQPDAAAPNQEKIQAQEAGAKEEDNTFENLLAAYEGRTQSFSEGEVIKGKVIAIIRQRSHCRCRIQVRRDYSDRAVHG